MIAIIIPYYKISYFEETLMSLNAQTCKKFKVYIGDDNSKENPVNLIDRYRDNLDIKYVKFNDNYGRKNLVKQWMRCFSLIEDEDWICFLPDDDTISINCIDEIYKAINYTDNNNINVNVIKIRLRIIGRGADAVSADFKINDNLMFQDNLEFYSKSIVHGHESCTLGDIFYRKSSFVKHGGFVEFNKGWGSDHATVLSVSNGSLICHVNNAYLCFRMSGFNISSNRNDGYEKLQARIFFAEWLINNKDIFPRPIEKEFFRFFYWIGEYYILKEWDFDFKLFILLFKLRRICFCSFDPIPIVSIFFRKIIKVWSKIFKEHFLHASLS